MTRVRCQCVRGSFLVRAQLVYIAGHTFDMHRVFVTRVLMTHLCYQCVCDSFLLRSRLVYVAGHTFNMHRVFVTRVG